MLLPLVKLLSPFDKINPDLVVDPLYVDDLIGGNSPLVLPDVREFEFEIKFATDLSANDGKNGSAEGKKGVVPLIFDINDRVRLKGIL